GRDKSPDDAVGRSPGRGGAPGPGSESYNGQAVIGAIGYVESAAIGAYRQGVGTAAEGQSVLRFARDGFHHLIRRRADNGHRVAVSVRHIDELTASVGDDGTGMEPYLDAFAARPSISLSHDHGHSAVISHGGTRINSRH